MKIGLVSYFRDPNYGTMLQAYALAEVIKNEGFECEYLRYYPFNKRTLFRQLISKTLDLLGLRKDNGEYSFFKTSKFKTTIQNFKYFNNNFIPVSKKSYYANTIKQANSEYEYFIVGSDQTWSPYMNRNPYTINFLDFVDDPVKKRSYAPSMGTVEFSGAYIELLKTKLYSFKYLSCRENVNCQLIKSLTGGKVEYVLDPTLLLKKDDWNIIATKRQLSIDYILCYILGEKECISKFAEELGKQKNLPVYYIVTRPRYLVKRNSLLGIGPSEFVSLVKYARYVVTDSFHGTLFSITYGINFYSFAKRKATDLTNDNARIMEFLSELNLLDRFRDDDDNLISKSDIDYVSVNARLDVLREKSLCYLNKILQ